MLRLLTETFPERATWRTPISGFFVWVDLIGDVDIDEVFKQALESEKVAFIPGYLFSADARRDLSVPEAARRGLSASGAVAHQALSVPATVSTGSKRANMRLNFSHSTPAQVEQGIPRLARLLKER